MLMCVFTCTGMLMGIAIRTGSPLSLSLAEPVWKQVAGQQLSVSDLTEIDKNFVPGMSMSHTLNNLVICRLINADVTSHLPEIDKE